VANSGVRMEVKLQMQGSALENKRLRIRKGEKRYATENPGKEVD
jgi:hypothetical protein